MRDRPLIQRRLLRRAIRSEMRSERADRRRAIRDALADDAIFEAFYEEAMDFASVHAMRTSEFSISTAEDGSPIVDSLLKLLTWFLENGPELVRMIELIIGLFGGAISASVENQNQRGNSR